MSIQLSPRDRKESGRRHRGNRYKRKSKSPRRRSSSQSRSPSRGERRRNKSRSSSPRRRRNKKGSKSPSRRERSRKDSLSPRRKRRSRSPKRRRSRRGGRSGRSRRERRRHRNRSTSTSRSPVRRSRRRKEYESSSSSCSNSETEYYQTRRRKRHDKKLRRPVVYRIGDKVEFKKSGGRRRRSRWVPVEVCEVHQGGMYGELTYSVWLFDSRRMVEFVCADELRFKYHADLKRRLREDELARHREDIREITRKLARQQHDVGYVRGRRMDTRGGRGRSQRAARAWYPRAHSVDEHVHNPLREDRQKERAMSVPPENTSWPAFFAEFAKATYRGRRGDCYASDDEQLLKDVAGEAGTYARGVRHYHDNRKHESEHDHRGKRGPYRVIDMSRGDKFDGLEFNDVNGVERTPPANDNYLSDVRGTYDIRNVKNYKGSGGDINVNLVLQDCRGKQDKDT